MKILKKSNKKIIFHSVVFIFAGLLIWFGYNFSNNIENKSKGDLEISENNPTWNTYKNKEYGFSIDFPSDWEINEDFKNVSPTINIYLPNKDAQPPFDHFANINNVSIFPKGLQTESVIGQSQKTEIEFDFKSDKSVDYLLEDGTVWASYINFDNLNEPWKPWSFMWARNIINDLEFKCLSSNVEVVLDECNPFEGDEFIRIGTVDSEIRQTQEKIIKSFKLIK